MVNKDRISIIIRSIISFGLLIALIWIMRDSIGNIWGILKNSNKPFFVLAILINIPLVVLLSYRLRLLMLGQGISLPMKDVIYLTFIGFFFNNFLPTAIGGDIVKAHYASKKTNNMVASYAAVLADRMSGLVAIALIAMIGLLFIRETLRNNNIIYAVCFVFIASATLVFFFLNKKRNEGNPVPAGSTGVINMLKDKLYKLHSAINSYRNKPLLLIRILVLSIFMQFCTIVSIYFFIVCLNGSLPLLKLFLIVPIVWTISMLPSLNGLGVREGAFVYLLKGDIGADKALAISVLWLGVMIIYSVIGGVLHLLHPVKVKVKDVV